MRSPTADEGPPLADSFDDDAIRRMVHTFYGAVREDPELAPVFDRRVTDWPHHLERMCQFWTAVLRGERVYRPRPEGGPPVLHRRIEELTQAHFDRWLALFERTAQRVFVPELVEELMWRARHMRMNLSAHLAA